MKPMLERLNQPRLQRHRKRHQRFNEKDNGCARAFWIYVDFFPVNCNPSGLNPNQTKDVTPAINSKRKYEKLAVVAHILQNTQSLVISRCRFAEDSYEMFKDL